MLLSKFQGVFGSNPDIEWFDALVGLLNTSGGRVTNPRSVEQAVTP
jgi:hypothetical protein